MKDVQVRGGYVLHIGTIEGTLAVGDTVTCTIDAVSAVLANIITYAVDPPISEHNGTGPCSDMQNFRYAFSMEKVRNSI